MQGLDAVNTYRTESGLYVIGVDYNTGETNPYDLSFDPHIKFDHDFVGKAAAEDLSKNIKRRYVTLTVEGEGETEYGATVTKDGAEVGVAPSPVVSPKFGPITLASLDAAHATIGTDVEVDGRAAKVAAFPIYDTEKTRPRS
jgi:glycine cleavage system aminomethyltransferase T